MKVLSTYIFLAFIITPFQLKSQVSFDFYGGLASYTMSDLKEVNSQTIKSMPFQVITVDNFNPGPFIGTSLSLKISGQHLLGLHYQYNTTGSRIGQKDYSGYYTYDQITNGHLIGIKPETIIEQNNLFTLSLSIMTGVIITRLKMKEQFSVNDVLLEDSLFLVAHSVPVYPSLKLSIPVIDILSGTITLGYLYDTGGKLHRDGNRYAVYGINGNPVKTGWTGFRITAGASLKFRKT